MKKAYIETWTESEAGWGSRPDGISLHLSEEDYNKFVNKHWEYEKKLNPSGIVPHEYVRQDNDLRQIRVSDSLYNKILKSKKFFGLRFDKSESIKLIKNKEIIY